MSRPVPALEALCRCGHPLAVHHRTESGNMTFCTVVHSTGLAVAVPCRCKRFELAA